MSAGPLLWQMPKYAKNEITTKEVTNRNKSMKGRSIKGRKRESKKETEEEGSCSLQYKA
jgi:hypothetical protein